ncbi:hypothetical protein DWW00_21095 [Bacteroides fragilis]|uniref:Transmembrane protein n=1 Tax=Bacteroides fragilis TaxID=817 RepID=A0A412Y8T1_BACFG|nr:hypothetical protein DWW08_11525 [Bacteroides fragilis]RGV82363.1 hypothetical protein DWW00_21095 [Bacteroides fragilis]
MPLHFIFSILAAKIYILAAKMYILSAEIHILAPKMNLNCFLKQVFFQYFSTLNRMKSYHTICSLSS